MVWTLRKGKDRPQLQAGVRECGGVRPGMVSPYSLFQLNLRRFVPTTIEDIPRDGSKMLTLM